MAVSLGERDPSTKLVESQRRIQQNKDSNHIPLPLAAVLQSSHPLFQQNKDTPLSRPAIQGLDPPAAPPDPEPARDLFVRSPIRAVIPKPPFSRT